MRKKIMALIVIAVIVIGELYAMPLRAVAGDPQCSASGCKNSRASGSTYCSTHTCHHGSCKSKILSGSKYCSSHTCAQSGCYREVNSANSKCSIHKNSTGSSATAATTTAASTGSRPYTYTSSGSIISTASGRRTDPYNVYSYSSAQDFADDKYEEFFDYEDDYEDEDEAYDAAEEYWYSHHKNQH